MKVTLTTIAVSLLAALFLPAYAAADDAPARRLMEQVYEQGRKHKSQRMDMEIVVRDPKGRERVRLFKMLYRIIGDETRSLLRFYKPSDIKGTGLFNIVYESGGRESDQWIYFPAFRRVNKLSAEEKHQSFMGSDFTNADIAGRKPHDDTHTMVKADGEVSVVSSVPRDPSDPYSRIESHIVNRIKVPERILFYDRSGRLLKTLKSKRVVETDSMFTIMEAEMSNHRTGGSTVMTKKSVNFKNIKPSQVTVSKLRNR